MTAPHGDRPDCDGEAAPIRVADPEFVPKAVAALLDPANQIRRVEPHEYGTFGGPDVEIAAIDRTERLDLSTMPPPYYGRCVTCGGSIHWLDAPTGGWWAHDAHPADEHDAEPMIVCDGSDHPGETCDQYDAALDNGDH